MCVATDDLKRVKQLINNGVYNMKKNYENLKKSKYTKILKKEINGNTYFAVDLD
jgi:hypothetical protein